MNVRILLSLLPLFASFGAQLHAAEAAPRPNILFIIFDDWNGSTHAGAYGCNWVKTPNFDRIAREGVLFKNAFTSNPKCSPCRASILTGRNTWQLEEAVCHNGLFPARFDVYPDLLEKAGYIVGLTGKGWGPGDFKTHRLHTQPRRPELRQNIDQAARHRHQPQRLRRQLRRILASSGRRTSRSASGWASTSRIGHTNTTPASASARSSKTSKCPPYLPDTDDRPPRPGRLRRRSRVGRPADRQGARRCSKQAGELDHTLVVVTSDHGMPFPFVKGQISRRRLPSAAGDALGRRDQAGPRRRGLHQRPRLRPDLHGTGRPEAPPADDRQKPRRTFSVPTNPGGSSRPRLHARRQGAARPRPAQRSGAIPCGPSARKEFLYVHNFHPERWPAGNPETDFGNCDPGPTKEVVKVLGGYFYELSFGKRPPDELYRITDDPECVRNLANDLAYTRHPGRSCATLMLGMLREEGDPRALGNGGDFRHLQVHRRPRPRLRNLAQGPGGQAGGLGQGNLYAPATMKNWSMRACVRPSKPASNVGALAPWPVSTIK